jgi:hypothetical protein
VDTNSNNFNILQYAGRVFERMSQVVQPVQGKRDKFLEPTVPAHVRACTANDQQIKKKTLDKMRYCIRPLLSGAFLAPPINLWDLLGGGKNFEN